MKNEYFELLNKCYPRLNFDSMNSLADIASQMGFNLKDAKLIEKMFNSRAFVTLVQKMKNSEDGNFIKKFAEEIIIIFNSVFNEFGKCELDNEGIAEILDNKLNPLIVEFEDWEIDNEEISEIADSKLNPLIDEFEEVVIAVCEEHPEFFDLFFEPETIVYESPEVSARNDSNFKYIIGYYKSKYRRLVANSDTSFINASCVCGGDN